MPNPSEAIATTYNTRTGQSLTQASQLIPILMYLMEMTLATDAVHEAIEEGANEGKQAHRETCRKVKEEKEEWAERKKGFMDEKAANEENKQWNADEWKSKVCKGLCS